MTIKTITITQDAYDAAKRLKREDESFSDLFLRLGAKALTLKDIKGMLRHTPAEALAFRKRVQEERHLLSQNLTQREDHVRTRLQRTH
ncbi:MAG: hypothetical protein QT07_C0002G0002 [archaeon GW2011_AR16]|nr:MAG: hypothetical protein QT07_C0002G0002 [archaeon GW2011_AR16]HII88182.1 hypothetical protein [Candidatus Woesearchaeota archaeon]